MVDRGSPGNQNRGLCHHQTKDVAVPRAVSRSPVSAALGCSWALGQSIWYCLAVELPSFAFARLRVRIPVKSPNSFTCCTAAAIHHAPNQLCFRTAPHRGHKPSSCPYSHRHMASCSTAEEGMSPRPAFVLLLLRFSRELRHVESRSRLGTDYQAARAGGMVLTLRVKLLATL
jgi:hypothetical protein